MKLEENSNKLFSRINTTYNYCENYGTGTEVQNKETLEHALFPCKNVKKNILQQVLNPLKVTQLTQLPVTASQIVLYDEFSTAKTLVNTVWMLLTCFILNNRLNKVRNNAEKVANKIKDTIVDTNKAYPNRNLARECRKLLLFRLGGTPSSLYDLNFN